LLRINPFQLSLPVRDARGALSATSGVDMTQHIFDRRRKMRFSAIVLAFQI
jgi:hypothetical protein